VVVVAMAMAGRIRERDGRVCLHGRKDCGVESRRLRFFYNLHTLPKPCHLPSCPNVLHGHSVQLMRQAVLDVQEVLDSELGQPETLDHGLVRMRGKVFLRQSRKG